MNYDKLMRECFTLARKGGGRVLTNPMVGAILIKDGEIISKGYHHGFGKDHAEVDCFKNAKTDARGATMIVNLEPCSHFGKNPPLSLIHISEPTRQCCTSRMPSSA